MSIREEQKKPNTGAEQISRRESAKKLAKMAYVVPAILAIVKTAERQTKRPQPALASTNRGLAASE